MTLPAARALLLGPGDSWREVNPHWGLLLIILSVIVGGGVSLTALLHTCAPRQLAAREPGWSPTIASLTAGDFPLRFLALVAACGVMLGTFAPWTYSMAFWDGASLELPGYLRLEGWLALMGGVSAAATAAWRIGRRGPASLVVQLLAFCPPLLVTAPLQVNIERWHSYGGGVPVEGWMWFEPRWGISCTLCAATVGVLCSLHALLHAVVPTDDPE